MCLYWCMPLPEYANLDLFRLLVSVLHISCLRRRPTSVCLCKYLPPSIVRVRRTTIHILQHPNEERRPLNTVSILRMCLGSGACVVYRGRKFTESSYPVLHSIVKLQHTFLFYPGKDANSITEIVQEPDALVHYNVIILDGTWKQAAAIYFQNKFLKKLTKVSCQSHVIFLLREHIA